MRKLLFVAVLGAMLLPVDEPEALNPNHECAYCHDVHGAAGVSLLDKSVVETLCLSCHGPAGISVLAADVHQNGIPTRYPTFRFTCIDCHDPHSDRTNWLGGTNIKLVGRWLDDTGFAKVATPNNGIRNTVFESRGTNAGQPSLHSFADNDEDANGIYDGICEVCHTLTRHHRNNSSGDHMHHTGETCTRCHGHADKFLPH